MRTVNVGKGEKHSETGSEGYHQVVLFKRVKKRDLIQFNAQQWGGGMVTFI